MCLWQLRTGLYSRLQWRVTGDGRQGPSLYACAFDDPSLFALYIQHLHCYPRHSRKCVSALGHCLARLGRGTHMTGQRPERIRGRH
jgi:hypothetical protein